MLVSLLSFCHCSCVLMSLHTCTSHAQSSPKKSIFGCVAVEVVLSDLFPTFLAVFHSNMTPRFSERCLEQLQSHTTTSPKPEIKNVPESLSSVATLQTLSPSRRTRSAHRNTTRLQQVPSHTPQRHCSRYQDSHA